MKPSFKRLIVFVFLLVLVSLAADVFADIQHADRGLQVRLDVLLHTAILLPVMGMTVIVPANAQMPDHKARPRPALIPAPFHPPTF